jgi:hypothetical protein
MKKTTAKRMAVGAAVVGAFIAGAVAGVKKNKVKALAAKAGRNVKSKARKLRIAATDKITDVRDRVLA